MIKKSRDKKIDFLFSVFAELNEHIRATDGKSISIGGSFVGLIAVVIAVLMDSDSFIKISWSNFVYSLFILVIGSCVYILQLGYRTWKEHYLEICRNIASNFKFKEEESLLPFWLRRSRTEKGSLRINSYCQ